MLRLIIAMACAAILIGARWHHERVRWYGAGRGRRRAALATGGRMTWGLYWLGLTTSAALAGQAVALLLHP